MRLGVGGVASLVVLPPRWCHPSSSLPFHLRSTPQAVARGAGGRWCVVHRVVLVLGSSFVVPIMPIGGGGVMQAVAPEPPCEQVLAAVGGGCWQLPSLIPLAPQHGICPQTTLRAAAHRHGSGWRGVPGCWVPHCCPSIVVVVAISTRNPTCEQSLTAGGRVLARLGIILVVVVIIFALLW